MKQSGANGYFFHRSFQVCVKSRIWRWKCGFSVEFFLEMVTCHQKKFMLNFVSTSMAGFQPDATTYTSVWHSDHFVSVELDTHEKCETWATLWGGQFKCFEAWHGGGVGSWQQSTGKLSLQSEKELVIVLKKVCVRPPCNHPYATFSSLPIILSKPAIWVPFLLPMLS